MHPHLFVIAPSGTGLNGILINGATLRKSRLLPQPEASNLASRLEREADITDNTIVLLRELTPSTDDEQVVEKIVALARTKDIESLTFHDLSTDVVEAFTPTSGNHFDLDAILLEANHREAIRAQMEADLREATNDVGLADRDSKAVPGDLIKSHVELKRDIRENGRVIGRIETVLDYSRDEIGKGWVRLRTTDGRTLIDEPEVTVPALEPGDDATTEAKWFLRGTLGLFVSSAEGPIEEDEYPDARDWINEHSKAIRNEINPPNPGPITRPLDLF